MRVSEIIPYIDLERMNAKTFIEILDRFERETPKQQDSDDTVKDRQYGDELHALSVEQAHLNAEKTMAEIDRMRAQATKDRSEAAAVGHSPHAARD